MSKNRFSALVLAIVLVAVTLLSSTVWVAPAQARICCSWCADPPDPDDHCWQICSFSC